MVAQLQPRPATQPGCGDHPDTFAILLVDDDPDCRMLIRDAIEESKVSNQVYEVSNGREAIEFLTRQGRFADAPRPGLIYLDVEMPGMGGQDTLRAVRAMPAFRDIPIVMMTGVSDEAQMRLAAENGANSYTLKPANAEQFLRTVLASTSYWLTIHQYPNHRLPQDQWPAVTASAVARASARTTTGEGGRLVRQAGQS